MWLRIFVFLILSFLILPIFVIFPLSFSSSSFFEIPPPGFSTRWYIDVLESSDWIRGFFNSLIVAIFTALISVIIGTMAALAIRNIDFKGKGVFMSIIISPMIIPTIIIGVALYYSLGPIGLSDTLLGLIISHSLLTIPIVFLLVMGKLNGLDKNLELAAISLGSSPIGAFFNITLPLMKHSIIAGLIFAFITSFDEVVMSVFIAGANSRTLPIIMWEKLRVNLDPSLAAAAALIILLTISIFILGQWISSRSNIK